jgi:PAS domain S-box-containing protein
MGEFFGRLFDSDFMPHGHCYSWRPEIVWLHLVSDALIALAYYSIPLFLVALVRKRRDVPFPAVFLMFGAFILACGTTHAMEIWTLWHGTYRLAGLVKVVTAVVSVGTALALVPIVPKALALRSPAEWEKANRVLKDEINERERAQKTLAESEARFRGAFDVAPIGMALLSPEGRYLKVNRVFSEMLGYSEAELLARDVRSITDPEDIEGDMGQARRLLDGEVPSYLIEKRYRHKDGRSISTVVARSLVRDDAGAPLYFISHIEDVSERKRAEEAVNRTTAEVTRVNAELQAFSYSVSHDLRAPLRAMQGFSQALLEDCAEGLDAVGRDYAERIVQAAARMDVLIRGVLAYSQLGTSQVKPQVVPLSSLVEQAVQQVAADVAARQGEVSVEEPLPRVVGQRLALSQVVVNLLTNAVKYVAPGVAPRVRIRADRRGATARLWVEDNGIGIAPEDHERIFRAFERLHGRESYDGTGIGLAIVRRAVERMGGSAGVDSQEGKGSRFWIELPAAADDRGEAADVR